MNYQRSLGEKGEGLAVKYLKNHGYAICERNYRMPYGEIDIICMKGNVIAFIEVKTRSTKKYGTPGAAVNRPKQLKLSRVALSYISKMQSNEWDYRFDVIEIFIKNSDNDISNAKIIHLENAFSFPF